ncbi:unnamed protein product [Candidula unifasciata]|uniref:Low molecular weight phosphotyrosine protein phosphatase n=1 Tax=Candidula unifasciata TaxID=100452 RepID=A0A8S3Z1C0_9EUPU|nr:unnamed protein product [Candidula unifasciata]
MAKSVLFVCFGNICRSTMAEALFKDYLSRQGEADQWNVDSAGHGKWHLGEQPEPRTLQVLEEHGIKGYTHTARLVTPEDFNKYDYILGMDDYNLRNLNAMKPEGSKCQIQALGSFDPLGEKTIQDPYFAESIQDYEDVFEQCQRCCKGFLEQVKQPESSN